MATLQRPEDDELSRLLKLAEVLVGQLRYMAARYDAMLKKEPDMPSYRQAEFLKKHEALASRAESMLRLIVKKSGVAPQDETAKVAVAQKPKAYAPGMMLVPTVDGSLRESSSSVVSPVPKQGDSHA